MINLTATTETNPQTIAVFNIDYGNGWYWQLKCVAWISQSRYDSQGNFSPKTTVKFKWQDYRYNYYPYNNNSNVYTLALGNTEKNVSFAITQSTNNGVRDLCSAQTLGTFSHNSSTGVFPSNSFTFKGVLANGSYIGGSASGYTEEMTLPTITPPSEPTPTVEPEPPTPIESDNIPYYYVYADDELVYGPGIEDHYILNPKLTLEVNKAGSFKFDIPVGSAMYNKIQKLKTTVEVRQGNEILFRGRLLNTTRSMFNTISCYCEGFLSWLVDITFLPYSRKMQARDLLKEFITRYNSRASSNRQISYKYSDISSIVTVENKDYSNAWDEINDVLIKGVGGYIVPYLTTSETGIQWLSSYGATTSQIIRFGENLLSFEEYIDASEIFNAVRPFGKEVDGTRVHLSENEGFVIDQNSINMFGRIERIAIFDEIDDVSVLRENAKKFLRTGLQTAMTMKLRAVDMHLLNVETERIRLGDSIRVVSPPHQLDAYFLCAKIEIDMGQPQNSAYTLGATQRTISELTNSSYNKFVITEGG